MGREYTEGPTKVEPTGSLPPKARIPYVEPSEGLKPMVTEARTMQPLGQKASRGVVPQEPGLVGSAYTEPKAAAVEAKIEGPGFKQMVEDIGEKVRVATGGTELEPDVPLRDQVSKPAAEPVGEKPVEKFSSDPRKATLQKAKATPEDIDTILQRGGKIDPTSKVGMSNLAQHFDVDLGQSAVGRAKGDLKAGTHIPPAEVLQQIIDAGHTPADIAEAVRDGKHLPKVSGGSQGAELSPNASGESSASLENINRVASQKAKGIKTYKVDSRSGIPTPILANDAVDWHPEGAYHKVTVDGEGNVELLESGDRARPFNKERVRWKSLQ